MTVVEDAERRGETGVTVQTRAQLTTSQEDRPTKATARVATALVDRLLGEGHRRAVTLILVVGLGVFANSIGNGFVADDQVIILKNPAIRKPAAIFFTGYWPDPRLDLLYRPLVIGSYAVNYALGGFTPWGYHLVNILLHAVNGALAYALIWRLFLNRRLALFSALAFALHPIHTEAVANVVGRADLLAAFFFFLAWLAYLHARDAVGRRRGALMASSILCFALALLSKEHAVVLLGAIVLSDLLRCVQRHPRPSLGEMGRSIAYPVQTAYPWYVATFGLYLVVRYMVLSALRTPISQIQLLDNPIAQAEPVIRILTATKVLGKYLWLLLVPHRLSADYSYHQIPVSRAVWDPPVLFTLLALVLMVALAWTARRRQPVFPFALLFFALTILPVSNLVFPIGTIMGERLMYLPSLGYCLAFGALVDVALLWAVGRSRALTALSLAVVGGVCAAYGAKTILRNRIWRDEPTFAFAALRDSPNSAKVRRFVGVVHARQGDLDKATAEFENALKILPDYADVQVNLGVALIEQRRFDEAFKVLQQAVTIFPDFGDAYYYMGKLYERTGKPAEAKEMYRRAGTSIPFDTEVSVGIALELFKHGSLAEARRQLEAAMWLRSDLFEVRNNLGIVYLREGRLEDALHQLRVAAHLKPDSSEIWTNLGKVLYALGQIDQAKSAFETALSHQAGYTEAKQGMGAVLTREGRLDEAAKLIHEALQLDPGNAEAQNNLGSIHERQGRLKEAEQAFRAALRIQGDYPEAHNNLGTVFGKQGKLIEARREFEAAVRLKPNYPKAHYNLGVLLQQLRKPDEAQREFQIARQQGFPPAGAPMTRRVP